MIIITRIELCMIYINDDDDDVIIIIKIITATFGKR